jgi:hypothetical protein
MEVGGQRHLPAALPPGMTPGPLWTGAENLASNRDSIPGPSSS